MVAESFADRLVIMMCHMYTGAYCFGEQYQLVPLIQPLQVNSTRLLYVSQFSSDGRSCPTIDIQIGPVA